MCWAKFICTLSRQHKQPGGMKCFTAANANVQQLQIVEIKGKCLDPSDRATSLSVLSGTVTVK